MRKLGLVITMFLVLLAASFVSPLAASASGTTPVPILHGPHAGARPSHFTSPSSGTRSPASASVAQGSVACDGNFDVVSSPNGTGNNYLYSTSAVSSNDVWAVGTSTSTTGYDRALAEHWNGSAWSIVATPNPGSLHDDLYGVSAISASDVWAVGAYEINTSGDARTFAEHWNGTKWTLLTSTFNPNPFFSLLFAVTAVSSNDVWAVGTYDSAGLMPLAEHWNGSTWSWVSMPNPSPTDNELYAVSAFSTTDIWAVGEWSGNGSGTTPLQSLAEHWNGIAWSPVVTSNTATGDNEIFGVNALEAGHAVGVGYGGFVTNISPDQGATWDLLAGGGSTTAPLTPSAGADNILEAVDRSSGSVWAVGFSDSATMVWPATWDSATHTLTWSGSPGTSASPSVANNVLFGVAAISPSVFWAAGYETSGTTDHTLAELQCDLALGLSAPATAAASQPFSVTVTAKNPDASTKTSYDGTVHFTSSDALATLPTDYTFVPADAGVHTFSGVVLVNSHNQPSTITVSDKATPFITATASVTVSCVGACQSPTGTPGSRGHGASPAGVSGGRGANQSPAGGLPGIRIASRASTGVTGPRPASIKPAAPSSSRAPSVVAAYRSNTARMIRVSAPAVMHGSIGQATRAASAYAFALAGRAAPVSPSPGQPPWYLLLLLPPLMAALILLVRLRLIGREAE
jgi:hypothetical protein